MPLQHEGAERALEDGGAVGLDGHPDDALLALGLGLSDSATLVTVSPTETWDGVNNPHSADGVTITGSGTQLDPYTYTIPNGMLINSTGKIVLHSAGDNNIKFVIQGSDLQMDEGAVLNTER